MYGIPMDEDWSFFVGRTLQQICFGSHDVQLRFDDDVAIGMNVEDPADSFRHDSVEPASVSARGATNSVASLLSLLGASVQRVVGQDRRTLAIYFSNGEVLSIFDSRDLYESFTVSSRKGTIVV